MAFGLIIIGIVAAVAGFRGTYPELGQLLAQDVPGFLPWLGAIAGIGLLGAIPGLEDLSDGLLVLVALVLVVANRRAFANLSAALQGNAGAGIPSQPLVPQQDEAALAAQTIDPSTTPGAGQDSGGSGIASEVTGAANAGSGIVTALTGALGFL